MSTADPSMVPPYHIHHITALSEPALAPYRTLRRPLEHHRQGIVVAEGEKVVRRLLGTSLHIHSLLLTPEWLQRLAADALLARHGPLDVYVAPKTVLIEIVGFRLHQGVMAVVRVPPDPPLTSLPKPHLLVALDGLTSAENVGVVVRNCAAFGSDGIIVGSTSSSPYLRRAVRNSMGTVFSLPIIHVTDTAAALSLLQNKYGTRIVAADVHGCIPLHHARLEGNICIVLGNEEAGVSAEVLDVCDERIAIPMCNNIDSLNVAIAAGVFLFEARRYRRSR